MTSRSRYWSNGKVANFIRGTDKPASATGPGWDLWYKASRDKHPFRYWLVEDGFDMLQNTVNWPLDKLDDVKHWFNNRYISKTHALTSTTLAKGSWHEFGKRVLHCNFDELVKFVEIETAWSHISWADADDRVQYAIPWYARGWLRFREWSSVKAGLDHLYWAADLTYDQNTGSSPGSISFGAPTGQAIIAKETLALYHWWKNVRPARIDENEASGWSAICERRRLRSEERGDDVHSISSLLGRDETPEEAAETRAALDRSTEIEAEYTKEDEEMLIRFVKLAPNLWT